MDFVSSSFSFHEISLEKLSTGVDCIHLRKLICHATCLEKEKNSLVKLVSVGVLHVVH